MNYLVTGATGFLGKYIVKDLLKSLDDNDKIFILTRPQSLESSKEIFKDLSNIDKIKFVEGDITFDGLFVNEEDRKELSNSLDHVIHAAAFYDLKDNHEKSYMTNVYGTQNLLNFLKNVSSLKLLSYVSTIAVAGDYPGVFRETDIDVGQSFSNSYSQTKYESEKLVRESKLNATKLIYRLGVLIGDAETGEDIKEDGPYYIFSKISSLLKLVPISAPIISKFTVPVPISGNSILPVVPVDEASRLIISHLMSVSHKLEHGVHQLKCFHVFSPDSPRSIDLFEDSLSAFGINSRVTPVPYYGVYKKVIKQLGIPESLIDYMYQSIVYDQTHFLQEFREFKRRPYSQYKSTFLNGARKTYLSERL